MDKSKKQCFKCMQYKVFGDFYAHPSTFDGRLGKCKECTKKDTRKHRLRNIKRIRKYDRERGKLPHRIKANTTRNKVRRKKDPVKYAAHTLVGNAVRDKRIIKSKSCMDCGKTDIRIYGHHDDYYKPLEVVWLCQVCHIARHKKKLILRS